MNPEDDKQPSAPQEASSQPPQAQSAPEGPVVQDVVAPTTAPSEQSPPAGPVVKQPPPAEEPQEESESTNSNDAEQASAEPVEPKPTFSLGRESAPPAMNDAGEQANNEKAKSKKPRKQKQPSHLPIGFIMATVVVALVLMGLVVMMYMNQEAEAPATPNGVAPASEPVIDNGSSNNDGATEETTPPDQADETNEDTMINDSPELEETDDTSTGNEDTIIE